MKSSVSGVTTAALAFAASLSLTAAGPHRAYAAPDTSMSAAEGVLSVSMLSPAARASFSGNKPVEVSAFYHGATGNPVVSVELLVDGQSAFTKKLDAPEDRGVISFLIDASQLTPGAHRIVVRAVAADSEIVSAKTSFTYLSDQAAVAVPAQPAIPVAPNADGSPNLTFVSPAADQKVQGTVRIEMQASDPSGRQPYVSLFVDKQFKTLRNYAPYVYDWDTTGLPNGYHTVEVYAYNDEQNVGPARVLRLFVNNPGGNTAIRTDLTDTPAAHAATRPHGAPALTDRVAPKAPVHRAVATRPIDRTPGASVLAPRKHTARVAGAQTPQPRMKAAGPLRRPSPRMALTNGQSRIDQLRTVLMAKRSDLLDQTGGLDLNSQLSDPFIPDTASPRPMAPARTPTKGFRPMPAAPAHPAAAAASLTTAAPAPKHVSVHTAAPAAQPAHVDVAAPAAQPKVVQPVLPLVAAQAHVQAAAPVARPAHVQAAAPVAKPAHVQAAAPVAKPVHAMPVTTAPKAAHIQIAAPVAQPAHVQAAAPVAKPTHAMVVTTAPKAAHIQIAAPAAHPAHVQAAAPIAQPAHAQVAVPAAQPKRVQPVAPVVAPKPLRSVRDIAVRHTSAIAAIKPAVHFMPIVRKPAAHTAQARVHMGRFSDVLQGHGRMMVIFNGKTVRMDRAITAQHGVTFSALRQIFEFQGGTLNWDSKTGTVHAVDGQKDITLRIGSRTATVNHQAVALQGRPYLASGRTMVPLSFVATALDAKVQVDPATGNLLITSRS